MLTSVNPYTNEIIEKYEESSHESIDNMLHQANKAYQLWKRKTIDERIGYIKKCVSQLEQGKDDYAHTITTEMGKTIKESKKEINKCQLVSNYFIEHGKLFLEEEPANMKEGTGITVYDPLGVILAIMPWNYPFWQFFRFAIPSLIAGNVIVLKHASSVPNCAKHIEEVFKKAGFPDGVVQNLTISSSKINDVIQDKRIRAITLTGSVSSGAKVAAEAGKYIKKTVLELGGSDPFIVLKDADIKHAAQLAVKARMKNFGQSCDAAKRFIVHEDVYNEFLSEFKSAMEELSFGDPLDEETDYASLSSVNQKNTVSKQVEKSVELGADVYWQGRKAPSNGAFFNPVILTNITAEMPVYHEEVFGPVGCVFSFETEKEAILLANDTKFGLGASIWTRDTENAKVLAREIEAGLVYINDEVSSKPELPFGGVKASGVGNEMSEIGIREFTNKKAIWIPNE